MKELRPCPFCGCDEFWVSRDSGIWPSHIEIRLDDYVREQGWEREPKYVTTFEIQCRNCGCALQGCACGDDLGVDYGRIAEDKAVEAWNERYERTCRMDAMPTVSGNPPYHIRCSACLGIPSDPDTPFCQWCGARVTGGSLWDAQGREASFDPDRIVFKATAWADSEDDVRSAMRDQIDHAVGCDGRL